MRIVVIGEVMHEISCGDSDYVMSYGGDTLNMAIHLRRFGYDVSYLTALGSDNCSENLKAKLINEGLDTSYIMMDPSRWTGLYTISTNACGERSFSYCRTDSAARQMLSLPGSAAILEQVGQADVLVYSLITLAILPPDARTKLLSLCGSVRARGGLVAFDGNYRPQLWASQVDAIAARDAALASANFGLPTLEDEVLLSGLTSAGNVASHWQSLGCAETVVKLGVEGCRLPDGRIIAPPRVLKPVDTSGAGDAFNGGYLAARLSGANLEDAALSGHRIAGWVVMRPGSIPAQTADAPYAGA